MLDNLNRKGETERVSNTKLLVNCSSNNNWWGPEFKKGKGVRFWKTRCCCFVYVNEIVICVCGFLFLSMFMCTFLVFHNVKLIIEGKGVAAIISVTRCERKQGKGLSTKVAITIHTRHETTHDTATCINKILRLGDVREEEFQRGCRLSYRDASFHRLSIIKSASLFRDENCEGMTAVLTEWVNFVRWKIDGKEERWLRKISHDDLREESRDESRTNSVYAWWEEDVTDRKDDGPGNHSFFFSSLLSSLIAPQVIIRWKIEDYLGSLLSS